MKEFDNLRFLFVEEKQSAKYLGGDSSDFLETNIRRFEAAMALFDFLSTLDVSSNTFSWKATSVLFGICCGALKYYGFTCPSIDHFMSIDHQLFQEDAQHQTFNLDISLQETFFSKLSTISRSTMNMLKAKTNHSIRNPIVDLTVRSQLLHFLLYTITYANDFTGMERVTLCQDNVNELLGYLSLSTASSDDTGELPHGGIIVGEIIGVCCQHGDMNFIAQTKRSLFMKLENSSHSKDRFLCLNAISCVISSLSSRIALSKDLDTIYEDKDFSPLLNRLISDFESLAINEDYFSSSQSFVIFRRFLVGGTWNHPMLHPLFASLGNKLLTRLSMANISQTTGSSYSLDIEILSRVCSLRDVPSGKRLF